MRKTWVWGKRVVQPSLGRRAGEKHWDAPGKGSVIHGDSALLIMCPWGPKEKSFSHRRVKSSQPGQHPAFPHQAYNNNNSVNNTRRGHLGGGVQFTIPWIYIAPFSSNGPLPLSPGHHHNGVKPPELKHHSSCGKAGRRRQRPRSDFMQTQWCPGLAALPMGPPWGAPGAALTGCSLCISGCRNRSCGWRSPAP